MLVDANLEYTKKDGNLYSKFTDIKCKTELLGAVHFDVDNLFDGNKPKGKSLFQRLVILHLLSRSRIFYFI